ncbi:MAG: pilus assembly PilX N-terminal domain-containing protein [Planctomycetes bacterium]|nr:pilus assembly PilX N-terminal domain-containing protein [Planctomycetota bacterium]
MQYRRRTNRKARRGNALLMALVSLVALTGIAGAILAASTASKKEIGGSVDRTEALYAAESGISAAYARISAGATAVNLGTESSPTAFGGGVYWGTAANASGTWTVTSVGRAGGVTRAVQAVITAPSGGVYDNAIFAGNSGNSGTYTMNFGGTSTQADRVVGDMYSGNSITFSGTATVDGIPRAYRNFTGPAGAILPDPATGRARTAVLGGTQPIPDLAAMNYPGTAQVNVASAFASATYASSVQGGSAYQLPKTNRAHIFRKNPSDRRTNWAATAKEDYFLEDPYQPMRTDSTSNGSNCDIIQLNNPALAGYGTQSGNRIVYYVDGNLWVHNAQTMSLKIRHGDTNGIQVTFVVKGNLYISDNIFYDNTTKDGLAFITLKDAAIADSGNIYFGDPSFGTLNRMDSFMYAENNFIDNNLDAAGSLQITVNGNMTAGNQVAINRDSGTRHTKMTVNQDRRITAGSLAMPGLPGQSGGGTTAFTIAMLKEVAVP